MYHLPIGPVKSIPTMQFSLESPEILSKNLICYHGLSVSGNSEIILEGSSHFVDYPISIMQNWVFRKIKLIIF